MVKSVKQNNLSSKSKSSSNVRSSPGTRRLRSATPGNRRRRTAAAPRSASTSVITRTEVWFTLTSPSGTSNNFAASRYWQAPTLPPWFATYSPLWESYEVLSMHVKAINNSSANTQGIGVLSYEPNPQQAMTTPPSEDILASQHRARTFKGTETPAITLDPSIFRQTPTRRWGPNEFLFALYFRAHFNSPVEQTVSIRFEVTYTLRFHTPQVTTLPAQTYIAARVPGASSSAVVSARNTGLGSVAVSRNVPSAIPVTIHQIISDLGHFVLNGYRTSPVLLDSDFTLRQLFKAGSFNNILGAARPGLVPNIAHAVFRDILSTLSANLHAWVLTIVFNSNILVSGGTYVSAIGIESDRSEAWDDLLQYITTDGTTIPNQINAQIQSWTLAGNPRQLDNTFFIGETPVSQYADQAAFFYQPIGVTLTKGYQPSDLPSSAIVPFANPGPTPDEYLREVDSTNVNPTVAPNVHDDTHIPVNPVSFRTNFF